MAVSDSLILCIDGGGTRSRGRLMTRDAEVIAEAAAGPCNAATDLAGAAASVSDLWRQVAVAAAVDPERPQKHTLAVGAAGIFNARRRAAFLDGVPQFGTRVAMSDGFAAMIGAGRGMPCGLMIVGTGAVAHRLSADGASVQHDGWGWIGGDRGSGAWIGREALRQLLATEDGIGTGDALTAAISAEIGGPEAYFDFLSGATPDRLAALARCVVRAAEEGDEQATALLNRAAIEVSATITSLCVPDSEPVFIAGGLAGVLRPRVEQALGRALSLPEDDAMFGAFLVGTARAPGEFPC